MIIIPAFMVALSAAGFMGQWETQNAQLCVDEDGFGYNYFLMTGHTDLRDCVKDGEMVSAMYPAGSILGMNFNIFSKECHVLLNATLSMNMQPPTLPSYIKTVSTGMASSKEPFAYGGMMPQPSWICLWGMNCLNPPVMTHCFLPDRPTRVPETKAPETSSPETSSPDTYPPDTSPPDTNSPFTASPDTASPDTGSPDTLVPDTTAVPTTSPDTGSPDTLVPDTLVPETTIPETLIPDTASPDTASPDTGSPDTLVPDTTAVPTTSPDTGSPDTLVPETTIPETLIPDTASPDTTSPLVPDTAAPTTSPATVPPLTAQPTASPETSAPETLIPSTDAPTANPTASPTVPVRWPACLCDASTASVNRSESWCASRYLFKLQGRECRAVQFPGGLCRSKYLKCTSSTKPKKYPPTGSKCQCNRYEGSAKQDDKLLCVEMNSLSSSIKCTLPLGNGTCAPLSTLCAQRKIVRAKLAPPAIVTAQGLVQYMTRAARLEDGQLVLISTCPAATCPGGLCPVTYNERLSNQCLMNFDRNATSRAATTLGSRIMLSNSAPSYIYADFDVAIDDETRHTEVVSQLYETLDQASDGDATSTDPSTPEGALRYLHVAEFNDVYPPADRTSSPVSAPNPEANWWEEYWWVVFVSVVTVAAAGVILRKTVRFNELVDFDSSRKTSSKTKLARGMEGCYRAHRGYKGRVAGLSNDEQEMCVDAEPAAEYNSYPMMPMTGFRGRGAGRGKYRSSVRSRSTESSGSSEPEVTV